MTTALASTPPAGHSAPAEGMCLRIDREALRAALKAVTPALGRASDGPTSTGMRIAATPAGAITVTCARRDLTIDHHLDEHGDGIEQPGTIVIAQARPLARILRTVPAGALTLRAGPDVGRGSLVVTAGETTVRLPALPAGQWPDPPGVGAGLGRVVGLDAGQLGLLRRILPLASDNAARPVLAAVHVTSDGMVEATDAYRLGVAQLGQGLDLANDCVVPARPLAAVLRATKRAPMVSMALGERAAVFYAGSTTWTIPLVEAEYPDMTPFRDQPRSHRVEVDAHQLTAALAQARALGTDPTPVRLASERGQLRLTRSHGDTAVTATLPATGDIPPLGFNPRFLADLVAAVAPAGGPVAIEADDDHHPAYARTDGLTVALMPVRVR